MGGAALELPCLSRHPVTKGAAEILSQGAVRREIKLGPAPTKRKVSAPECGEFKIQEPGQGVILQLTRSPLHLCP